MLTSQIMRSTLISDVVRGLCMSARQGSPPAIGRHLPGGSWDEVSRAFDARVPSRLPLMALAVQRKWWTALLSASLSLGVAAAPTPIGAAEMSCASHSLNRDDVAHAEAVARPALRGSVHLDVTAACWNPDSAVAEIATQRVRTQDGVDQWWAVSCRRDESTWACDSPELRQFIAAELPVADRPHAVELSFGSGIPLARARSLASRALSIYANTEAQLRPCGTIEAGTTAPVTIRRADNRASADESFHVNVTRDGLMDSVWLDDAGVKISFDASLNPADEQSPCWKDVVVVN